MRFNFLKYFYYFFEKEKIRSSLFFSRLKPNQNALNSFDDLLHYRLLIQYQSIETV
jgi:hypothetical protein